jgi:hypothetical protein
MKLHRHFFLLVFVPAGRSSVSRPKAEPLTVLPFPEPPPPQAKWNVGTNLVSTELMSATRTLFEQGFGCECEYRQHPSAAQPNCGCRR